MTLEVQLQSIIYSFVYGLFFSLLLNWHYHYIFDGKKSYRIIVNLFFLLDNVLLYFLLLRRINNGVIHPYFILLIFAGFFVGNRTTKVLRHRTRKKEVAKK